MKRIYESLLEDHFKQNSQMAFIAGPRQVGKTTSCSAFAGRRHYFNWDNEDDQDDQRLISAGPGAVADRIGATAARPIVFDELHKYPNWKIFLKGFYDTHARGRFHVVVTGSSRLDVYRKGADSLMGRYFMYRMHPITVGEVIDPLIREKEIRAPRPVLDDDFIALIRFGGFPEPYLKRNKRFYNRWKTTRLKLLFREDLRDTTRVFEISQVELLAGLLRQQAGQLTSYASLARKIRASQDSVRRWISVLESLYYCFTIRPWHRNVTRSLLKEPKIYMTDWSLVDDVGSRNENFIACHLHKAVNWWQDQGFGEFGLYFLRTKDRKEVDFLVVRDQCPWFMVEVKSSDHHRISRGLAYFQSRIHVPHAFEVIMDARYEDVDSFSYDYPVKIPARTFLSQLV